MSLAFMLDQLSHRAVDPMTIEPIPVSSLPTPALVLDKPRFERNLQRMAEHLQRAGKGARPHAKTHKCPVVAKAQLDAGAEGVCVAKVSEAVALSRAGIAPILITSPIASPAKAAVVAQLAAEHPIQAVVDSQTGVDVLAQALHADTRLDVLLDIDIAMGRTGVRGIQQMLGILERITQDSRFRFVGLQHYAGHVMHIHGYQSRRDASLRLWEKVEEVLAQLAADGFACQIVTGGGTGTFDIDTEVAALTDLQVGSYVMMDEQYREIGGEQGERFDRFEIALTVACTAISQPTSSTITVDGGYKAFASDAMNPVSDELPHVEYRFAGDEHGVLKLPKGEQSVTLGSVVELVVPHCDPTVNLHDWFWVREADGLVHSAWPITARGCTW